MGLILNGVTIRDFKTALNGGAIYGGDTTGSPYQLTIKGKSAFRNNTAETSGGAIYLTSFKAADTETRGKFIIRDATFSNNKVVRSASNGGVAYSGSAIYLNYDTEPVVGETAYNTVVDISKTTFTGNQTVFTSSNTGAYESTVYGGVIYAGKYGQITISQSNFVENALSLTSQSTQSTWNSMVVGGVIYSKSNILHLTDTVFDSNSISINVKQNAVVDGGVIYFAGKELTITGTNDFAEHTDLSPSAYITNEQFNLSTSGSNSSLVIRGGLIYVAGVQKNANTSPDDYSLTIRNFAMENNKIGLVSSTGGVSVYDAFIRAGGIGITSDASNNF